jgi:hypothetical protein
MVLWLVQDWCMISKSLPLPMSPLLGGLMGAVVGGLIDSLIQPSQPQQSPLIFTGNNCSAISTKDGRNHHGTST